MRFRSLPKVIVTSRSWVGSDVEAESTRTIDRLPRGQAHGSTEPHDHAILSPPCLAIAVIAYAKSTPRTMTARCATSIAFDALGSAPTWVPKPVRRNTTHVRVNTKCPRNVRTTTRVHASTSSRAASLPPSMHAVTVTAT